MWNPVNTPLAYLPELPHISFAISNSENKKHAHSSCTNKLIIIKYWSYKWQPNEKLLTLNLALWSSIGGSWRVPFPILRPPPLNKQVVFVRFECHWRSSSGNTSLWLFFPSSTVPELNDSDCRRRCQSIWLLKYLDTLTNGAWRELFELCDFQCARKWWFSISNSICLFRIWDNWVLVRC